VSLETHISQCAYESIKGFFAIHNSQMTQLSKDNERLRCRTDELEGTIRILRQELEWVKIALGPWCRPIYPDRPSVSSNYAQYPTNEDASTASVLGRAGPIPLRAVDPTGGTSHPEPRAENGATEGFDLVDPFSFSNRRRNQVPGVYATNTASTTADAVGADSDTSSSAEAVESQNGRDLNGEASYNTTTRTALSHGVGDLQSTFSAPPAALLSDYFPSEDREELEEGGPSSRPQGWQHVSSPIYQMTPNTNSSTYSPVSIPVLERDGGLNSLITHPETWVTYEQNQPLGSGPNHSHLASPYSAPCNRQQYGPSINKYVVAPLNLSTTVEGSLVGLRESLVTLSAALESQGRRQEMALTTEGLRFSEEVGSLKAIVQGLRMQVSFCIIVWLCLRFPARAEICYSDLLYLFISERLLFCLLVYPTTVPEIILW